MKSARKGIGGHQSHSSRTVEWLTPPETIEGIGGWQSIDCDPCAPIVQPYPTALRTHTILDDGLAQVWDPKQRYFVNPPYGTGEIEPWLERLADHGRGTLLVFARTETDAIFRYVWERAHAVLMMRGRIHFHVGEGYSEVRYTNGQAVRGKTFNSGDRAPGNAGGPTMLCAYGVEDMDILATCNIAGQFLPLIVTRSVLVEPLADRSWRELVADFLTGVDAPIRVADLYRAFADHPKSKSNPNWQAKLRQQLYRGAGVSVGRDQWVPA